MEHELHVVFSVDIHCHSSTKQKGLFPRVMLSLLYSPCASIFIVIFIVLKKNQTLFLSKKYGFLQFFKR